MKIAIAISAGLHLIVVLAVLIGSWNTTYSRQSAPLRTGYRQVSLVSAGDIPGRPRPLRPAKAKTTKSEIKSEPVTRERAAKESQSTGGKGESRKGGISTGLSTDTAFPYGYYLELIEKKIEGLFSPPIKTPGLETNLHFVLERNGRATGIKVQKSSGNAMFDQAAMRAVLSANPLPPLPSDFGASTLGILYIFRSQ